MVIFDSVAVFSSSCRLEIKALKKSAVVVHFEPLSGSVPLQDQIGFFEEDFTLIEGYLNLHLRGVESTQKYCCGGISIARLQQSESITPSCLLRSSPHHHNLEGLFEANTHNRHET